MFTITANNACTLCVNVLNKSNNVFNQTSFIFPLTKLLHNTKYLLVLPLLFLMKLEISCVSARVITVYAIYTKCETYKSFQHTHIRFIYTSIFCWYIQKKKSETIILKVTTLVIFNWNSFHECFSSMLMF